MKSVIYVLVTLLFTGCAVDRETSESRLIRVTPGGDVDVPDYYVPRLITDGLRDTNAKPTDPSISCGLPDQCQPWNCWVDGTTGEGICTERTGTTLECSIHCGRPAFCPMIWELTKCNNECAWATGITWSFCWASCHNATSTSCEPGRDDL